jgi:ABC-type multidrug transport system fused ATPase/permease subunit
MIRDAPVLILDEPTAGIDAESSRRIMEPLRRLIGGRTTIVISHNLMTTRDADQIAVIDAGCIVERGNHETLLASAGLYARLYRRHHADQPDGAGVHVNGAATPSLLPAG